MVDGQRFDLEDVECGAADAAILQDRDQVLLVDNLTACRIHDPSVGLHARKVRCGDQIACPVTETHMDTDKVGEARTVRPWKPSGHRIRRRARR